MARKTVRDVLTLDESPVDDNLTKRSLIHDSVLISPLCGNFEVMRMTLPSDLDAEELAAAANGSRIGPAEEFVTLPEGQMAGYLEIDLRPDQRYLYWTVPGEKSVPDGKVWKAVASGMVLVHSAK